MLFRSQMFQVTTQDLKQVKKNEDGSVNYDDDFFGKQASLTVSGQLEGELAAMGLGAIYTFGPTFRAENSNTPRHLAEFWMIEPEVAFNEIEENMNLAEEFIKYCVVPPHLFQPLPDMVQVELREAQRHRARPAGSDRPIPDPHDGQHLLDAPAVDRKSVV